MEPKVIAEIIRRVPIFYEFDPGQVERILKISKEVTYEAEQFVFHEGDPSTEMLFLISGKFRVQAASGAEIAMIGEAGIVGEMGVLTDQPRSAGVVATEPCVALSVSVEDLFRLIAEDKDVGYKIYRIVTHLLSDRLRESNIILEQQYLLLDDIASEDSP